MGLQIAEDKVVLKGTIEEVQIIPTKAQSLDWQCTSQQQKLNPGDWNNIFKILRESNFQPEIGHSAKVTCKNESEILFS